MLKYLDIEPGAVSIMGLMNDKGHDVTLLIGEGWITFDMYHKKEHRERKTSSMETFSFRCSFVSFPSFQIASAVLSVFSLMEASLPPAGPISFPVTVTSR